MNNEIFFIVFFFSIDTFSIYLHVPTVLSCIYSNITVTNKKRFLGEYNSNLNRSDKVLSYVQPVVETCIPLLQVCLEGIHFLRSFGAISNFDLSQWKIKFVQYSF
jgi:hypothetical protein